MRGEAHRLVYEPLVGHTLEDAADEQQCNPKPGLDGELAHATRLKIAVGTDESRKSRNDIGDDTYISRLLILMGAAKAAATCIQAMS